MKLMEFLASLFSSVQEWLFESVLQPVMFAVGLGNLLVDGYAATGWLLVGLLQLAVLVAVITDRATVRVDMIYTAIHRLGLFRLALFFSLDNWFDTLFGALRVSGFGTFNLDAVWPGVTDLAWVSLIIYLVVFDALQYAIHRGQHQFEWWWKLHSLHHAQRQMTMWSDNRNHLLDDVLKDVILVAVAQLIGIPPGQFVAVVAFTQLSESFQHANLRVWFGHVGERLWVSPRFHRLHHSVGIGHESAGKQVAGKQVLGGHNFGVLLPWWDMLFGTANFELRFDQTGVRDQIEGGRDYGRGFWSQQWQGVKRLAGRA
jgi:sterol desaturase/sphingolipid hydroxylase (fatty acid hydroxylase superfamily)